jgi:hypothetical protein
VLVLELIYTSSLVIVITTLLKCSLTDPGIIPAIQSQSMQPNNRYCKKRFENSSLSIDVKYEDEDFSGNKISV